MASKPYDPKDFYFRKAHKDGLRARSAYKIEEILDRHRLVSTGGKVLDLGAAPGGWLQIFAKRVGPKGRVIGVDLVPIKPLTELPWVTTAVLDIRSPTLEAELARLDAGPFDLVTSDMAPKTSGIKAQDEARSLELSELALTTAARLLPKGGHFVCKVFMGGDFQDFVRACEAIFAQTRVIRPKATRERSFEHYVVGLSRR
ncbi:MAG: RlmE family RNA methyltransferase [Myxococcales bacterium]|nr:RlmE family RNA methyltransferase [Myxococcales bacterium]